MSSASRTRSTPEARPPHYGTTQQFGVFRCSSSVTGPALRELDRQRVLPEHAALVHLQVARARYGSFKTPSRNIVCGYVDRAHGVASMECGIKSGLKPPPKPIHCHAGDPNDKRVSLRDTGRAAPVLCAGDPGPLLPQIEAKASVLAYGSSTHFGAITCTSARPASPAEPRRPRLLPQPRAAGARSRFVTFLHRRPGSGAKGQSRAAPARGCAHLGETLDHERVYDRFHEIMAERSSARRRRRLVVRRRRGADPRRLLLDGREPARRLDLPGAPAEPRGRRHAEPGDPDRRAALFNDVAEVVKDPGGRTTTSTREGSFRKLPDEGRRRRRRR